MLLTRIDLLNALNAGGASTWCAHLNGTRFATVSHDWVRDVWSAGVAALRANAPARVEQRAIGGGATRLFPRYILNGFCCRGVSLFIYAHGMTGFALQAAQAPTPLDHDALAFGWLEYTAEPRAANYGRDGRHEQLWFVDHAGNFQTFEGGDGDQEPFTPSELKSITFIFAQ